MSVKERVMKALDETGLSIPFIAKKIDVNESTLYRWKSGSTDNFKESKLIALARVLQVDYNWLQFGSKNKNPLSQDNHVCEDQVKYTSGLIQRASTGDVGLDDLPELIRIRNEIDKHIQRIIYEHKTE